MFQAYRGAREHQSGSDHYSDTTFHRQHSSHYLVPICMSFSQTMIGINVVSISYIQRFVRLDGISSRKHHSCRNKYFDGSSQHLSCSFFSFFLSNIESTQKQNAIQFQSLLLRRTNYLGESNDWWVKCFFA